MPIIRGDPEPTDADLSLAKQTIATAAEAAESAPSPTPAPDPNRIGVVFVHGIGSQPAGETLLDWTAPIVRTVRGWHLQRGIGIDPVLRAQIDFSGATVPIVKLAIPAVAADPGHPAQEWTFSEAWWARDVDPPSALTMLGWVFRGGEFNRIINGVFGGLATNGETGAWIRAEQFFLRLFAPALTILGPVVYGVVSLLKIIPITPLQDEVAKRQLDFILVDWFGDVRVLVTDRVQAANIRAKVARTIKALMADGCGRVVVIAHSGGAIVSYMSLADPLYIAGVGPTDRDADLAIRVDRLVTHGQGLELAWQVGHAEEGGTLIADDRLGPGDRLMELLAERRPELEWTDFWATHDPAPAGPIGGTEKNPSPTVDKPGHTVGVHNRMSLVNDHGAYWENDEQFVLPVVRLIETTGSPTESRYYPTGPVDLRGQARQHRVRSLAEWWAWFTGSGLALLAIAGGLERYAGGRGLERLGSSIVELVRIVTNFDDAGRQWQYPILEQIGWIAGLIPAPGLDVASYVSVLPVSIIGWLFLIVFLWVAGKPAGRAWNGWDTAARAAALTDAAPVVHSRGFAAMAPLMVGLVWFLVVALIAGIVIGSPTVFVIGR